MRIPSLFALIALAAAPACAGETPWQEVAPDVRLRLISSGTIEPDGTTLIALEIDMPQASKTYWRVPGETGLPTVLDFAGSTGIGGHQIVWPYPTRQDTEGYLDYVYLGPTVLPIEVEVSSSQPHAEVDAMLGVCAEVCLPAQAKFSLPLTDASPDRPNGLRIKQALALTPMSWEGKTPVSEVSMSPDGSHLEVRLSGDELDPASLIAATEDGEPLFGTPQNSPEADLVLIPVLAAGHAADLEGQAIELTFMTDHGAFEVTHTVGDAPSR